MSGRPEEEGTHVESGSFGIDRAYALRKLQGFQLSRADAFILPWVRWAAASGADSLEASEGWSFTARCNGEPLPPAFFEDPYAALFTETPDPRLRNAASALLAAHRTQCRRVEIISGMGAARRKLVSRGTTDFAAFPESDGGLDTVLRVCWRFVRTEACEPLDLLRQRCPLTRIGMKVGGQPFDPWPLRWCLPEGMPEPPFVDFDRDGVRGRIWPMDLYVDHPLLPASHSLLTPCQFGVGARPVSCEFPEASIAGDLNDDRFQLDASLEAAVQDARFKSSIQVAASHFRALVDAVVKAQAGYETLSRFLFKGSIGKLEAALHGSPPGQWRYLPAAELLWSDAEELRRWIHWETRAASWLRDVAARVFTADRDAPKSGWEEALWEAPLYLTPRGKTLSLRQLAGICGTQGGLTVSGSTVQNGDVWLPRGTDPWLKRLFPGLVREAA